ncbi:MAG: Rpn family recombination-promoting nuclease/putative transposase [Planctomycetota bacterium]
MGHHDKLTRSVFESTRHMRDLLRMVLPRKLVAALDLHTLELCPGSYVDRELKDLQFDLPVRRSRTQVTSCSHVRLGRCRKPLASSDQLSPETRARQARLGRVT